MLDQEKPAQVALIFESIFLQKRRANFPLERRRRRD